MRTKSFSTFLVTVAAFVLSGFCPAWGQEPADNDLRDNGVAIVVGHPFSAIKYARQVRVLADGKQQFVRNERYPTLIARDQDGRVMMQQISTDDLPPECDRLELRVPPICPAWGVFVIDPIAHTVSHWPAGELAAHVAVDFPFTEARLEETAQATAEVPQLPPAFSDEDGKVSKIDLGERSIEGVDAFGVRSMLQYATTESGRTVRHTRIHEVWTAPAMKLIVRVIDGDPNGVETVWGLEKISLSPDPSLFQPPADYEWQHRHDDKGTVADFEFLESWFAK
jgi:hypothetical protein